MNHTPCFRRARHVSTIIIGGGQAGLAISYYLSQRAIDHLILERGEVANSWRHERWDSLRLLTPNWQTRLPGHCYQGLKPDDYMTMPEIIDFIGQFAQQISAPIQCGTTVTAVHRVDQSYHVRTTQGDWVCSTLVIASGAFNIPVVPEFGRQLAGTITTITPHQYRNPAQLADGGVLVVGASATGLQLADEIQQSGRQVILAVGEHVRMPRYYRGRDILWWMETTGLSDQRYDEVDDITRARQVPSPQLAGSSEHRALDLNRLTSQGVQIVGRLSGIRDHTAQFAGSLPNVCKLADLKLGRLLSIIDQWIEAHGLGAKFGEPDRLEPTDVGGSPRLDLNLASGEIKTIIWATGFRPDYSWLKLPVLDRKGMLIHDGGIVNAPGMYILGLPFMRRRKSSFIHGVTDDAYDISQHLANYLSSVHKRKLVSVA
ncbi:MAG: NAD(P)-binding domain-containing protein [Pseudomonadales bacterium]|nr:NAD(P)-binding domain-containing protein [Pseudomonadales bacterium]MCP5216450.1 NAD(P)-binding domain-containing protein [Pseudomonadales bacterium]